MNTRSALKKQANCSSAKASKNDVNIESINIDATKQTPSINTDATKQTPSTSKNEVHNEPMNFDVISQIPSTSAVHFEPMNIDSNTQIPSTSTAAPGGKLRRKPDDTSDSSDSCNSHWLNSAAHNSKSSPKKMKQDDTLFSRPTVSNRFTPIQPIEEAINRSAHQEKFPPITILNHDAKGHDMALSLSKKNIQTTLISDSSCFGVMSRVNKVIIGTQAVMANRGLRAVALAAKFYSVPVIVLAGMYKLSPTYVSSIDQDKFNEFLSPASVISYCQGQITSRTRIINPVFDFVPPELITLFISNIGSHAPSYMYRSLSELHHPDNTNL